MAAVDMFLKLDGIDGESQDAAHKGEIELFSYSWGMTQTGTVSGGGGGGGTGKASFQDLHFESAVTKASPLLAKACATGEHIKKAVLAVRKAGDKPVEYIKITMEDVLVSSYSDAGARGDEGPEESISLNFAKIEFDYFPQRADGSLDSPVIFRFDVLQNRSG